MIQKHDFSHFRKNYIWWNSRVFFFLKFSGLKSKIIWFHKCLFPHKHLTICLTKMENHHTTKIYNILFNPKSIFVSSDQSLPLKASHIFIFIEVDLFCLFFKVA